MKWPSWLYRLVPYLGSRRAEEDLQEELRLHLELERERQRDAGLPETDALRAARQKLGNAALIRERTRDVWGWRWLDDLGRDLRHAARGLRRNPGFTATVVLVLALGIGANTAMFSIVYGMLIRELPYPDASRIVRVGRVSRSMPEAPVYLSARMLAEVQEAAESFEQFAAYGAYTFPWTSPDGARPSGAPVSPALLRLLGARPHLGRLFTDDDARVGADGVVLLSHGAWTRRFGASPDVVGSIVDVNGERRTVVGVLADGFYFPSPWEEVWTPYVLPPNEATAVVLGRLREGVSAERAATEVRAILQRRDGVTGRHPSGDRSGRIGGTAEKNVRVVPLQEEMVGEYRPALAALTAATALVLLIACTNVAGLLLARGVTRRRALAVCAALGAGRGRIVRQLLAESMVLSLSGGVLGLASASVVLRAVPALVPGNIVRLDEVGLDGVVLAFTLGLSVIVGLVFGAAPAFQWSGRHLLRTIIEGSLRSTGGFGLLRANRTRAALAAQVALALVLLVGAVLLLRSFVGLVTVDRGYDPDNVIAAGARYPDTFRPQSATREEFIEQEASKRRFYRELDEALDRVARLTEVAAVGVTSSLPLAGSGSVIQGVHVVGRPVPSDPRESPETLLHVASPGYFGAMRLRLLGGRLFTRQDGAGAPRVLVVNETFAREVLRGAPAVGQRVRFIGSVDSGGDDVPWEVIGVVADVTYGGLAVTGSGAEAFAPVQQINAAPTFAHNYPLVTVRTIGDPLAAVPFLREAVAGARPGAAVEFAMTMDARLSYAVAQPRFYAMLVGCFAALAFFLAAFGVYGLLSYTVAHRRGEIAIRMALGAQRGDVLALVVRQGAVLVAAGAVIGLAAAASSSRILESFLYGVATDDVVTFVAAPLALVAVALFACYVPARRATRIEPMEVLRFE